VPILEYWIFENVAYSLFHGSLTPAWPPPEYCSLPELAIFLILRAGAISVFQVWGNTFIVNLRILFILARNIQTAQCQKGYQKRDTDDVTMGTRNRDCGMDNTKSQTQNRKHVNAIRNRQRDIETRQRKHGNKKPDIK
jgi:hypothetical protein